MACSASARILASYILKVTSRCTANVLRHLNAPLDEGRSSTTGSGNALLDYFYYIFEKFPACSAFGTMPTPTRVALMLPTGKKCSLCFV